MGKTVNSGNYNLLYINRYKVRNNWSVSDFTIYHVIKIDLFKQIESILAILSEIHFFFIAWMR